MWLNARRRPKRCRPQAHVEVVGAFSPPSGALMVDEAAHARLLAWLAAGPPPVFLGFGSMVIEDPRRIEALIVEAARCGPLGSRLSANEGRHLDRR